MEQYKYGQQALTGIPVNERLRLYDHQKRIVSSVMKHIREPEPVTKHLAVISSPHTGKHVTIAGLAALFNIAPVGHPLPRPKVVIVTSNNHSLHRQWDALVHLEQFPSSTDHVGPHTNNGWLGVFNNHQSRGANVLPINVRSSKFVLPSLSEQSQAEVDDKTRNKVLQDKLDFIVKSHPNIIIWEDGRDFYNYKAAPFADLTNVVHVAFFAKYDHMFSKTDNSRHLIWNVVDKEIIPEIEAADSPVKAQVWIDEAAQIDEHKFDAVRYGLAGARGSAVGFAPGVNLEEVINPTSMSSEELVNTTASLTGKVVSPIKTGVYGANGLTEEEESEQTRVENEGRLKMTAQQRIEHMLGTLVAGLAPSASNEQRVNAQKLLDAAVGRARSDEFLRQLQKERILTDSNFQMPFHTPIPTGYEATMKPLEKGRFIIPSYAADYRTAFEVAGVEENRAHALLKLYMDVPASFSEFEGTVISQPNIAVLSLLNVAMGQGLDAELVVETVNQLTDKKGFWNKYESYLAFTDKEVFFAESKKELGEVVSDLVYQTITADITVVDTGLMFKTVSEKLEVLSKRPVS